MKILALESSAKAASVALMEDGSLIAQYSQCSGLTHSRTLLPMLEDMLKNTETKLSDVELIAVAHGPGSFTGIRIGVSTVKGLAWAAEKPCVGVSTLGAMAWHGLGFEGIVCPVMDARRQQVYNALFEIENGEPRRLCADRAIALAELAEELRRLGRPALLIGDGAELSRKFLSGEGIDCRVAPANLVYQSAWGVGMEYVALEEIFKRSDVISLHCPLTPQTRNLIGIEQLRAMKKTAILINTSRGPVVNLDDLYAALKSNTIRHACLDVVPQEPPQEHPIFSLPNATITPHIGWASKEARQRLINGIASNIKAYADGRINDIKLSE